jgi:hypothetical protein
MMNGSSFLKVVVLERKSIASAQETSTPVSLASHMTVETDNITLGNFSHDHIERPTVIYHIGDIPLLRPSHMVEGKYAGITRSAVLARMRVEIIINILTVFFSGIEFCNTIYVLYLVFVLFVSVTPSLLLAVAAVPLGESIGFIAKVEFAPGFPLLLGRAKPFVGVGCLIVECVMTWHHFLPSFPMRQRYAPERPCVLRLWQL